MYLPAVVLLALLAVAASLYVVLSKRGRAPADTQRAEASPPSAGPVEVEVTSTPVAAVPKRVDAGAAPVTADWNRAKSSKSTLRLHFENDPRDEGAAAAEDRIRAIFAAQPGIEGVVRNVTCTKRVCRIEARWSHATTRPYNAALVQLVEENTRELEITPDGAPDGPVVPVSVYIRRGSPAP
jgi:hypothetical protein